MGPRAEQPEEQLATSRPERDRWPDEPRETHEPIERDDLGRFLRDAAGRRITYPDQHIEWPR